MGILHLSIFKDCTRKDVCIALYVIASSPPKSGEVLGRSLQPLVLERFLRPREGEGPN